MTPRDTIERFAGLRVLVVGEAMLDSYVHGHAGRLCREAPVPIVAAEERDDALGGAANTAAGIAALGAQVAFVSVTGNDDAGAILSRLFADARVDAAAVFRAPGRATMVKQRIVAGGQLMLRVDTGSEADLDDLHERRVLDAIAERWDASDAVIVSDYGYGILTPAIVEVIAAHQRRAPRIFVADAKDLTRWAVARPTAVKPNYGEALALLAAAPQAGTLPRIAQIEAARGRLAELTGADIVAVTLDTAGALVFEGGREPWRTFTRPAPGTNAAGAGDVFTGTLALALAAGAHTAAAADLASAAATACVATGGTSVCTAAQLRELIDGERKCAGPAEVAAQVAAWRAAGKRIVFTNGCFDIIHHGHISYLNRAKAMGDVLVIGLNADASVRGLKGDTRPINTEADRAAVLAALSCVDLVVMFDEPTPERLIEALRPDLYVKGGDYTLATLPEAPLVMRLGGEVKLLPYLDDRSTTGIIERIRRAYPAPLEATGLMRWPGVRRVLCVRLDSLGDVLMTTPALRAVKEAAGHVTLLTSPAGAAAARFVSEIDEVIVFEAPWMKAGHADPAATHALLDRLRGRFDAAVIFTVWSQNPLPAATIVHLAGIPLSLAHCRERAYHLLSDALPETEPEGGVRHEVRRQLDLVAHLGWRPSSERLSFTPSRDDFAVAAAHIPSGPWAVVHPGASAASRRYPPEMFGAAMQLLARHGWRFVVTGDASEATLAKAVASMVVDSATSLAGRLSLGELGALITRAPVLITNNSGPAHIAAAVGTPVVDLYALTNPQHTPWQVTARVLTHDVPCRWCLASICPEGHHLCLRGVAPEVVAAAALELVAPALTAAA